jgi:hypothetical protein
MRVKSNIATYDQLASSKPCDISIVSHIDQCGFANLPICRLHKRGSLQAPGAFQA